jgi:hypothetical protein
MAHHIFQLESELQNTPGAPTSFSVSEKLARYGSSALTGVEHLTKHLVSCTVVQLALRVPPLSWSIAKQLRRTFRD